MAIADGSSRRSFSALISAVVIVALLGLTAAVGAAVAAGGDSNEAATSQPDPAAPMGTNAKGQSYGSSANAESPAEEPDLIHVMADNGKVGYCCKDDLEGPAPVTPEDADAITEAGLKGYKIPVYESDGVTRIGVFTVGGPGSECGGTMANGGSWKKTSNEDGTITTVTTKADGTVSKTTE
jgi:hypothetical protein